MNTPYAQTLESRRLKLERLLAMQAPMERIIARLPDGLENVSAANDWLQISEATREQVLAVLNALHAGKWEKKVCHASGEKVDYETTIEGVPVLLFHSDPPTSCRIETEEVIVPEYKVVRRKLVCV